MERERLDPYVPVWEGPIENWSRAYARKNEWRVTPVLEREDLVSEAYIYFCICRDRYKNTVFEPQHFMSLFMTSVWRRYHTLAGERGRRPDTSVSVLMGADCDITDLESGTANDCTLSTLLLDAPAPLRRVLECFDEWAGYLRDSDGVRETNAERAAGLLDQSIPPYKQEADGTRECTNAYLCRLAGVDANEIDIVEMINTLVA